MQAGLRLNSMNHNFPSTQSKFTCLSYRTLFEGNGLSEECLLPGILSYYMNLQIFKNSLKTCMTEKNITKNAKTGLSSSNLQLYLFCFSYCYYQF